MPDTETTITAIDLDSLIALALEVSDRCSSEDATIARVQAAVRANPSGQFEVVR